MLPTILALGVVLLVVAAAIGMAYALTRAGGHDSGEKGVGGGLDADPGSLDLGGGEGWAAGEMA